LPQEAHGLTGIGGKSGAEAAVPNTDSCFWRSVEWQPGHSGTVSERTSASKSFPHFWQTYSKIGMWFSSSASHFAAGSAACANAIDSSERN
jgi:hypothetical protein